MSKTVFFTVRFPREKEEPRSCAPSVLEHCSFARTVAPDRGAARAAPLSNSPPVETGDHCMVAPSCWVLGKIANIKTPSGWSSPNVWSTTTASPRATSRAVLTRSSLCNPLKESSWSPYGSVKTHGAAAQSASLEPVVSLGVGRDELGRSTRAATSVAITTRVLPAGAGVSGGETSDHATLEHAEH
jgi:hypothetical protein